VGEHPAERMETQVTAAAPPLLELCGIGKSFPGVTALADVDLVASGGEVHALVGANGAGKSTLIALLSGVYAPTTGVIRVSGRQVTFRSPREANAAGISTVYQELTVLPNLLVCENVFLGREPKNRYGLVDVWRLHADARELFDRYGLELDPGARAGQLTLGQQQILELARALSTASKILVLDELTAGLSLTEQQVLFAIVERLKRAGLLILYVSHRLEEVFALADRVTVLRDGKQVITALVADLSHRELVRLMVGHDVRGHWPAPQPASAPLLKAALPDGEGIAELVLCAGEIVGLIGLRGSGRSRLGKSLVGLIEGGPTTVWLAGECLPISSPAVAAAHGIVYLTEDRKSEGMFSGLTILANTTAAALALFSRFGFIRFRLERRAASDTLRRMRLRARSIDIPVRQLSGGNQQKTLFARALLANPKVLICDEPTRGIDVGAKDEIYAVLLELARQGMAIIFISSEFKELLTVCHRLLIVRHGRIRAEVSPKLSEHELVMLATGLDINEPRPAGSC
jgi:ABC-type sugar transport system ATPase subunit